MSHPDVCRVVVANTDCWSRKEQLGSVDTGLLVDWIKEQSACICARHHFSQSEVGN